MEFAADGKAHYLIPTEVTVDGTVYEVGDDYEGSEICVWYYKANPSGSQTLSDGTTKVENVSAEDINTPGTYYAAVYLENSTGAQNTVTVEFTLVAAGLDGAYICDGKDADDKVIEFADKNLSFGGGDLSVAVDGEIIEYNSIKVYKKDGLGGTHQTNGAYDAGEYYAKVSYNGQTKDIPFEVKAIDLASANFKFDTDLYASVATALPTGIKKINDLRVKADPDNNDEFLLGGTSIKISCDYTGDYSNPDKGEYTYTISSWQKGDATHSKPGNNVYGETTVTVVRYENEAEFTYNNAEITGDAEIFDFDASKVKAYDKLGAGRKEIPVEISYMKKDSDGNYTISVTAEQAKPPASTRP